jgi:HK97 family phage prohead protease
VDKGAFTKTLSEQGATFPMLWQHDSAEPIGVMSGVQDERGLFVKGNLNMDVSRAREAYALLKQGAIRGLSIGYVAVKWAMEGATRHLQEIKLYEGSVVTFPANELATVSHVKAAAELTAATESLSAVLAEMKSLLDGREPGVPTRTPKAADTDSGEPDASTLAAVKQLVDDMRRVA